MLMTVNDIAFTFSAYIKTDLPDIGCECLDLIQLAVDRVEWLALLKGVMSLQVPQKARNICTSTETVSFSRRTWIS
jgi:hypothetical protein